MPQRSAVIKGTQGFSYQGLNRAPDKHFRLNGLDVFIQVVDQDGVASAASVVFQTNLKKVQAAKIINVTAETGNAVTGLTFTFGSKGQVTVGGLNTLNANDCFAFVAIGSRN